MTVNCNARGRTLSFTGKVVVTGPLVEMTFRVPEALAVTFAGDRAIPSEKVTDLMLEMLQLQPSDKVLEIGTGSGYQTKRFAESGAEIHTVELMPFISEVNLDGATPIYLHAGDGQLGLAQESPFSAIVATCGVERIPDAWRDQLVEGGRLVAPIGDAVSQKLTLFMKHEHELIPERVGGYVRFQMVRNALDAKAN